MIEDADSPSTWHCAHLTTLECLLTTLMGRSFCPVSESLLKQLTALQVSHNVLGFRRVYESSITFRHSYNVNAMGNSEREERAESLLVTAQKNAIRGLQMPRQITDVAKFLEMTESATECRVKRSSDQVKLKLRTGRYLYTLIVEPQQAETILQQVKCQVVEAKPKAEE